MKRGRDIAAFCVPVNKKRETNREREGALEEGEPEELLEVGEKAGRAGDGREGTDTERDILEGDEEGVEEENMQGQIEEQPVDPCGSSTPSGL